MTQASHKLLMFSERLMRKAIDKNKLANMTLNLTDQCNSRCRMCDIWRKEPKTEISAKKIESLLSENLKGLQSICLTGGEPFLRKDLPDIYSSVKEHFPRCRLSISTNALLKKEMLDFLDNANTRNLTLHISLDGTNKHDCVRGTGGAFRKTCDTIKEIRKKHPKLDIETKFTITPWNYDEILDTYRLSKELKTRFRIKMIQNLEIYTNTVDYEKNKKTFSLSVAQKRVVLKQLDTLKRLFSKEKRFHDIFFVRMMMRYLNNDDSRLVYCNCVFSSVFIMPDGDVYLCRYMDPAGNINSSSLNEIWNSKKANRIRTHVRGRKCQGCISLYGFYS